MPELSLAALPSMYTASGHPIRFDRPELTPIEWSDLSVHLARVCRYHGARDVTVLAHLALCVQLARELGADDTLVAHCAAHDLHEGYLGDLHPSLKRLLPAWEAIEERWERRVHLELGLAWPVPVCIARATKLVDVGALQLEIAVTGGERGPSRKTAEVRPNWTVPAWRRGVDRAREVLSARPARLRVIVQDAVEAGAGTAAIEAVRESAERMVARWGMAA